MKNKMEFSPQQRQAFKRIELIGLWEGRLNATHLMNALDLSRGTASKLINEYKELFPENLCYNATRKGHEPSLSFNAHFSRGLLDEYLALNLENSEEIVRLNSSHQPPDATSVRPIIQAIKRQERIDICYASLNNPQGEDRIISPHSLINDGQRWHVRGWCEKSQDYRDFVLSRIREIYGANGQAQYSAEQDEDWNTWVEFSIEPDSRLSQKQQSLIALDYGMELNPEGRHQRHYCVRGALVLYWFQHLRIDKYRETPEAQQIILSPESRENVKKWLP